MEARGPLTLMHPPRNVRSMIWWQTMRPEIGVVIIVSWAARTAYSDERNRFRVRLGRFGIGWFRHTRTALIDRKQDLFSKGIGPQSLMAAQSSEGRGEHFMDYWGVAAAWTFFNDTNTQSLQRLHLDLSRPDGDDGPNGYGGHAIVLHRAGVQTVNFAHNLGGVLDIIKTMSISGYRRSLFNFSLIR